MASRRPISSVASAARRVREHWVDRGLPSPAAKAYTRYRPPVASAAPRPFVTSTRSPLRAPPFHERSITKSVAGSRQTTDSPSTAAAPARLSATVPTKTAALASKEGRGGPDDAQSKAAARAAQNSTSGHASAHARCRRQVAGLRSAPPGSSYARQERRFQPR
jgi:hypothetical protein